MRPDARTEIPVNKHDELKFVIKACHIVFSSNRFGFEVHSFHDKKKEQKNLDSLQRQRETLSTSITAVINTLL